jgi:AAA+ superfamily predicted ATPase
MTSIVNRLKLPVHIEVEVSSTSILSNEEVTQSVKNALTEQCPVFSNGQLSLKLQDDIQKIIVCDLLPGQKVSYWQADLFIHSYRLIEQLSENDYLEGAEELPVAEQMELPNLYLQGLWESIIIEDSIKSQLLSFACTSILFSLANIDSNIISWNKMLLLYGPPGTGKTSLCKALAQKVFIRNSDRFNSGIIFEVNCHSLFSKWFSESGKLVMKLFNHISEIAEDSSCFIVLLIDEVESIASARSLSSKSGEPGDAIRVVNAVLTSLDSLKRKSNILVLCTSNMVGSLDEAFVDRLDFKVFIGLPNYSAR